MCFLFILFAIYNNPLKIVGKKLHFSEKKTISERITCWCLYGQLKVGMGANYV